MMMLFDWHNVYCYLPMDHPLKICVEEMWQKCFSLVCIDNWKSYIQYIPRNMHTVTALLCFVVVIHWLIFPYQSGLLHWHCGNLTIAPVPAKQPWWIWINTSYELIMNDCITTIKHSKTVCIFLGIYCSCIFLTQPRDFHDQLAYSRLTNRIPLCLSRWD